MRNFSIYMSEEVNIKPEDIPEANLAWKLEKGKVKPANATLLNPPAKCIHVQIVVLLI